MSRDAATCLERCPSTRHPDALYAEVVAAGAVTPGAAGGPYAVPADTPWGTREFHLRDPGGNVLQFYGPTSARRAGGA